MSNAPKPLSITNSNNTTTTPSPPHSLGRYRQHLLTVGKSPHTIRAYISDLRNFAEWFLYSTGEVLNPQLIASTDIIDFRRYQLRRGRKPKTINRRLVALQRYFKWAKQQQLCQDNPFDILEGHRVKEQHGVAPKWLDEKQQNALLREVRRLGNVRDLAIIQTLRRTGLRVSELASLKYSDFEIGERVGSVWVRDGKGGKSRTVPLSKDSRQALSNYLVERQPEPEDFVFRGQRGPLSAKAVRDIVGKYAYLARLDQVTPHTLRHTFGKNLVNAETPLDQVATLLGHENIETVKIYVTPSERDLEKAVRQASGEIVEM